MIAIYEPDQPRRSCCVAIVFVAIFDLFHIIHVLQFLNDIRTHVIFLACNEVLVGKESMFLKYLYLHDHA